MDSILLISVCILTKNAAKTIVATLNSLQVFPEVLILDTGSTDSTLSIAEKYSNVKIFQAPFSGFGALRNEIAQKASCDWILALDSDEVVSSELVEEIQRTHLDQNKVYSIPRHNFYQGQRIYGCGWGKEFVARLYHRKNTQFSLAPVHEALESKNTLFFQFPIFHTPYLSTEDFLRKMQQYSSLFAQQYQHKRRSSFGKALAKALFTFFRSYILQKGFLDRSAGFVISIYNANTTFYKYLKLKEINNTNCRK